MASKECNRPLPAAKQDKSLKRSVKCKGGSKDQSTAHCNKIDIDALTKAANLENFNLDTDEEFVGYVNKEYTSIPVKGGVYKGPWHSAMHGVGQVVWADGRRYIGNLVNGSIEGRGRAYSSGGNHLVDGIFSDSVPTSVHITWERGIESFGQYKYDIRSNGECHFKKVGIWLELAKLRNKFTCREGVEPDILDLVKLSFRNYENKCSAPWRASELDEDGSVFFGEYDSDGFRREGFLSLPNGDCYCGFLCEGTEHGLGILRKNGLSLDSTSSSTSPDDIKGVFHFGHLVSTGEENPRENEWTAKLDLHIKEWKESQAESKRCSTTPKVQWVYENFKSWQPLTMESSPTITSKKKDKKRQNLGPVGDDTKADAAVVEHDVNVILPDSE